MRYPYWLKVFMDILNKDKASRKVKGNSVLIKQGKPTMLQSNKKFMDNNIMTKKAWKQHTQQGE